ncbi:hypothetical protein [Moorena producens]|uniref:hypothetical protein n=1 Tax=Moorena producens TaxID=1155739 RepID=UPI001314EFC6|nr:hypothetical protein [Moorena producens]
MQSLMGETTAVAHGGDPQDRAASLPRLMPIPQNSSNHSIRGCLRSIICYIQAPVGPHL